MIIFGFQVSNANQKSVFPNLTKDFFETIEKPDPSLTQLTNIIDLSHKSKQNEKIHLEHYLAANQTIFENPFESDLHNAITEFNKLKLGSRIQIPIYLGTLRKVQNYQTEISTPIIAHYENHQIQPQTLEQIKLWSQKYQIIKNAGLLRL